MKLYIGVDEDGTEIISKQPIKRFFNFAQNKQDVLSYNDTLRNNHWMLDYTNMEVNKHGENPINIYLTLPSGSIKKMFNLSLTWEDEAQIVEL